MTTTGSSDIVVKVSAIVPLSVVDNDVSPGGKVNAGSSGVGSGVGAG